MNYKTIWDNFLSRIKEEVEPVMYETWFEDTSLVDLKDNYAIVLTKMPIQKKSLNDIYLNQMKKILNEITESNFDIKVITEDELQTEDNVEITMSNIEIPIARSNYESNLESKFTFDNYIIGKSNKFAKMNAIAIAERPGQVYNPFFIYGPSGVGKTHLMHAIGNYIVKNSNKKVLYTTSEKFVTDFIRSQQRGDNGTNFQRVDDFKNKYRDIDVLIIDDIQYFEIAAKSQQEFFNTFNELHSNNKQIIISSDRSPNDLKKFEDRLLTRFAMGISVDIMPPDFDLRMDIIQAKLKNTEIQVEFPDDVKDFIAGICSSDVRTLEGCINRVLSYSAMMYRGKINIEIAEEALNGYIKPTIISLNKMNLVQQIVAKKFNISVEDLKSANRSTNIKHPRQIGMYICRVYLKESLSRIGNEFGGKDHTTVMHSVKTITDKIKKDHELADVIQNIVNQLN